MASCNMCRNGKTALGRDCPNGCEASSAQDILDRLQAIADEATGDDEGTLRDAIGLIVSRLQPGEYQTS